MIKKIVFIILAGFLVNLAGTAYAFTTPSDGTLGYQIYDMVFNGILRGPIGFVFAMAMIGMGIFYIVKSNIFGTLTCCVAAVALFNIDAIVISLGVLY